MPKVKDMEAITKIIKMVFIQKNFVNIKTILMIKNTIW